MGVSRNKGTNVCVEEDKKQRFIQEGPMEKKAEEAGLVKQLWQFEAEFLNKSRTYLCQRAECSLILDRWMITVPAGFSLGFVMDFYV